MIPEFVMTFGIAGCGKSSWIKEFNKNNKYIVISPDEIRKELTGDISNQSRDKDVWILVKAKVWKALDEGNNVILDATNLIGEYRRKFCRDLPFCKKLVKIFYVDAEEAKKRINNDISSGKDRANVPPEVIDKMFMDYMKQVSIYTDGNGYKFIWSEQLESEGFMVIED